MAEWRKINGWPYSVSDDGQVRNDRNGHILKAAENSGYHRVCLWDHGKGKNCSVHRLVAIAFLPNDDKKPEVNHKDGNKGNNVVGNLEWVTGAENKRHCREVLGKVNRHPNTEAAHNACKKRVRCVNTGAEYESITAAAKAIGVSQGTLSEHLLGMSRHCRGMLFEYATGGAL